MSHDKMIEVLNAGYRAQYQGLSLSDNPYEPSLQAHWLWRDGFLEAVKDSN